MFQDEVNPEALTKLNQLAVSHQEFRLLIGEAGFLGIAACVETEPVPAGIDYVRFEFYPVEFKL